MVWGCQWPSGASWPRPCRRCDQVDVVNTAEYLAALRRDGAAFAAAARAAGLDAPVASCPGWLVADLVWHHAEVHYFWASIVDLRAVAWNEVTLINRVSNDELFDTYDKYLARVVDVLSAADPATKVWSWSDQHDVSFVIRRMAQETAVHRWDAEQAAGLSASIEPTLASDGIDEFLEHFVNDIADDAEPVAGSVHIHCTDVPGEWTIRPITTSSGDAFDVAREHAKGDCALRGPAGDLLLALWRRIPVEAVDVIGDASVGARFVASANLT